MDTAGMDTALTIQSFESPDYTPWQITPTTDDGHDDEKHASLPLPRFHA